MRGCKETNVRTALFAIGLMAALGTAAPALADHTGQHEHGAQHAAIAQARAHEIAQAQGVAHVRESRLRRGVWKVEGHTADGREIEVEIDAHSGEVTKREVE